MSATGGDVLIRFTGDASQLQAAATQAQAAVNKTGTATAAAGAKMETAAKSSAVLAKTSADTSKQMLNLKMVISERLAPAIGMISPQAGMAAQSVGRLAAVAATFGITMTALAATLAIVAVPLAAIALYYRDLQRETRLENELVKTQKEVFDSLIPSTRKLEDSRIDLAVATGDMTDEEARYLRVQLAAQRAVLDFAKAQEELRAELQKQTEVPWWASTPFGNGVNVLGALLGTPDEMEAATGRLAALDRGLARMAETQIELRNNLLDEGSAKAESTRASVKHAGAVTEEVRVTEALIADLSVLAEMEAEDAATKAMAADALQRTIDEKAEGDRLAAEQRQADIDAYVSGWTQAADKLVSIFTMLNDAEYQQKVTAVRHLEAAFRENRESMTKEERKAAKERIAAAKEAARRVFKIGQALAITESAIAAAVGISKIWAQFGAWPPVAIGLTVLESAMQTAQMAIILSQKPKFHAGGMRRTPGDEVGLPGEGVVNRQAVAGMGGAPAIDALNAGHGLPPAVTVIRIGRLEAREIARTDIRANGMIPQYVGRLVGNQGKAGVSGRLAVA